jgi:BirA family biotin operon repressor/biotin-[acetyl-CoA-carboxylase] ligase
MLYIGKNRIHYTEIDSTNSELKRLNSESPLNEGTLLTSDFQGKGRGQRDRIWESLPEENFLGTFFLKPSLPISDSFVLNIISSLAVKETIEEITGLETEIKWPNDILVAGEKISGILVETQLRGNIIEEVFVGIGVNVNQNNFSDFTRKATSLKHLLNEEVEMNRVIDKLCFHLQQFYSLYKLKGYDTLSFLYHQHLYLKGESALYLVDGKERELVLQSVSKDGKLNVFNGLNKVEVFDLKEIVFLK